VSDSFDVKRGGVTVARVTLKPRAAKIQPDPKPDPVGGKSPDSPKPVPYPTKSTLVEAPGWQILADATKDE
jgi:hypothetical protein